MHVLEGSGLLSVTVDGHVLALEGLDDEVGDDTAVVGVHTRTKGVENTGDTDVDTVLAHVAIGEGLGHTLALVVARTGADTVDVTPVVLALGVLLGVAVDLGGRGDEEASLGTLGKTEHVHGTEEGRLEGLDSVVLVVGRRGGAGEVVNFCGSARVNAEADELTVDLDQERVDDIVSDHLKVGVSNPVRDLETVSGVP